jgi:hypothetical protein
MTPAQIQALIETIQNEIDLRFVAERATHTPQSKAATQAMADALFTAMQDNLRRNLMPLIARVELLEQSK